MKRFIVATMPAYDEADGDLCGWTDAVLRYGGSDMARIRPTVGIKDVARLAGVSVGTVSNVMNKP